MNFEKRGSTEIMTDILKGAEGGCCKTNVIRAARTNHVRGSKYIERCLEAGLLVKEEDIYVPSEKGRRLLDHWYEVEQRLPCD